MIKSGDQWPFPLKQVIKRIHRERERERERERWKEANNKEMIVPGPQMRNAIHTLQILASSLQSNPNLPTPSRSCGSGLLARSSSHPPDALCWNPPVRLHSQASQTDWPTDLLEAWVRSEPQRVLGILGLDPELLLRPAPANPPTPSPSSPPPPPYEPLSPLLGTPPQSPGKDAPLAKGAL
jgi:hypothetical protein